MAGVSQASVMAEAFLDEMRKIGFIGYGAEASMLGIPSAVGYQLGQDPGRMIAMRGEDKPGMAAGFAHELLIPGAIGYRAGKRKGWEAQQTSPQPAPGKQGEEFADEMGKLGVGVYSDDVYRHSTGTPMYGAMQYESRNAPPEGSFIREHLTPEQQEKYLHETTSPVGGDGAFEATLDMPLQEAFAGGDPHEEGSLAHSSRAHAEKYREGTRQRGNITSAVGGVLGGLAGGLAGTSAKSKLGPLIGGAAGLGLGAGLPQLWKHREMKAFSPQEVSKTQGEEFENRPDPEPGIPKEGSREVSKNAAWTPGLARAAEAGVGGLAGAGLGALAGGEDHRLGGALAGGTLGAGATLGGSHLLRAKRLAPYQAAWRDAADRLDDLRHTGSLEEGLAALHLTNVGDAEWAAEKALESRPFGIGNLPEMPSVHFPFSEPTPRGGAKTGSLGEDLSEYLEASSREEDAQMQAALVEQEKQEAKMQGSLLGQPGLPPGQGLPSLGENMNQDAIAYNPSSEGYGG